MRSSKILALSLLLFPQVLVGQGYVPTAPTNPAGASRTLNGTSLVTDEIRDQVSALFRSGEKSVPTTVASVRGETASSPATVESAAALPTCSPVPPLPSIQGNSLTYHQSLMSRAAAAQLGLIGGSVGGSTDNLVVVRDYSRTVPCLATDGRTTLVYGQALRTVISVTSFEAQAGMSLQALAANATISGKNSSVTVQIVGFESAPMRAVIASIAGKELNVETYADFASIEARLLALVDSPSTTQSVQRLGLMSDQSESGLRTSIATAFAVYQIQRGRSCTAAKSDFRDSTPEAGANIEATYTNLAGGCNAAAPSPVARARAQQILAGIKVER